MPDKTTGFASPAQGYEEEGIDIARLLIMKEVKQLLQTEGRFECFILSLIMMNRNL